jgi:hypothetical protein
MQVTVLGFTARELPGVPHARLANDRFGRTAALGKPTVSQHEVDGAISIPGMNQDVEIAHVSQPVVAIVAEGQGSAFQNHALDADLLQAREDISQGSHALPIPPPGSEICPLSRFDQATGGKALPAVVDERKESNHGGVEGNAFAGIQGKTAIFIPSETGA